MMNGLNIYKRKDGRYEGRIVKGKKADGKRSYQYFFGRTKQAVQAKMRSVQQIFAPVAELDLTIKSLYEEWLLSIQHRVKESTLANYQLKAEKHILPNFGSKRVLELSAEDIYQFIQEKQEDGLSNRYIADILIEMKSIFKYAVRKYHIANTIRNFVRQMRYQMPCVKGKKIIVAAILNRISEKLEYEFQEENIYFESIDRILELNRGVDLTTTKFSSPSKFFLSSTSSKPNFIQLHFENARKPTVVSAYLHNCEILTSEIQNRIHFIKNEKVLFLGTEECMYPAIYAAKRIEQLYSARTFCYATTRSPICICSEKSYPVQNGFQIFSLYEEERVNYIYNLKSYDVAIILSDSNSVFLESLSVMDAVLASYNIQKRYYFLGGK